MEEKDVPVKWVDAAMTGAAPGCRDDARFYLANAYETVREDILWTLLGTDPTITCACGMEWDVLVEQGPDHGHGRELCPSAPDAVLTLNGSEVTVRQWRYGVLADWAGHTGRRCITGWVRSYDQDADIYNGPLEAVSLPGRTTCPTGQKVYVDVSYDGTGEDPFIKVEWHDKSWM